MIYFPKPQVKAIFVERPQRFLANVRLSNGQKIFAYCANPGSLKGCLKEGSPVLLWDSQDTKRKRRYTLRAIKPTNTWIGTDTHLTNRLIEEALLTQALLPFVGYSVQQKEYRLDAKVRIDFLLKKNRTLCFLEVKSVCIAEKGIARFPDSATPRGIKHLRALARQARKGQRAALLFVVQRGDVKKFRINSGVYPDYDRALQKAIAAGVEIHAVALKVSPKGFTRLRLLPVLK